MIVELGERPPDAYEFRDANRDRRELWWRGHLVAWLDEAQLVFNDNGILDWNEVRSAFDRGVYEPVDAGRKAG